MREEKARTTNVARKNKNNQTNSKQACAACKGQQRTWKKNIRCREWRLRKLLKLGVDCIFPVSNTNNRWLCNVQRGTGQPEMATKNKQKYKAKEENSNQPQCDIAKGHVKMPFIHAYSGLPC